MEITKIEGNTEQLIFPKILNASTRTLQIWKTTYIAVHLKKLDPKDEVASSTPKDQTKQQKTSWRSFFKYFSFENNDMSLVFAFFHSFYLPGCCWDVCVPVSQLSVWEWGKWLTLVDREGIVYISFKHWVPQTFGSKPCNFLFFLVK